MKLIIQIPCFNEAKSLPGWHFAALPASVMSVFSGLRAAAAPKRFGQRSSTSNSPSPATPLSSTTAFILALAPLVLVAATWDHSHRLLFPAIMRYFSVPLIVAELSIVVLAARRGMTISMLAEAVPASARYAVAFLLLIMLGTLAFTASDLFVGTVRTVIWVIHLLFAGAVWYLLAEKGVRPLSLWPPIVAGLCVFTLLVVLFTASVPTPNSFDYGHLGLAVTNVRHLGYYSAAGAGAAIGACSG